MRADLEIYVKSVSEDFKRLAPSLYKAGFKLVIASFTDSSYYGSSRPSSTFVCGEDLIKAFLHEHFPDNIANAFFLCPFYPALHPKLNIPSNKNYHIRKVCEHFKVEKSQCVLFDDTPGNVQAADGFKAYDVDRSEGFRLTDFK